MRRSFLNLILLCSILLASLFSTEARAWYCDGRLCSTDTACCCISTGRQDIRCTAGRTAGETAVCKYGCGCKLVIKAAGVHLASLPSPILILPFPALLPLPPFTSVATAPVCKVFLTMEARGPPARSVAFVVPSLRAPPVA